MSKHNKITKGYGICIRNTPIDKTQTVAYQELTSIGFSDKDTIIDIVRSDTAKRPLLEELINSMNQGDRIDIYSIDTFLIGDRRKATEYYTALLNKGVDLLIYDFSASIAKLSPFSTLRFGNPYKKEPHLVKTNQSKEELIQAFSSYASTADAEKNSGGLKKNDRADISEAFKEIYFAYESYQISQKTTLELLKDYCGIRSKVTFWLMAKDYERTTNYAQELEIYSAHTPEILELPKRCGGLPSEYYEILNYALDKLWWIKNKKECIEIAMIELGFIAGYDVFHRWELLAEKKPKPKVDESRNSEMTEFKKKYRKKAVSI